jgi:NhaP-type Na+/H+ or K+/H+ antiporter
MDSRRISTNLGLVADHWDPHFSHRSGLYLVVFQVKHVDQQLFYLGSGESVLNDAVSQVLSQEFAKSLVPESEQKTPLEILLSALGSPILGVLFGVSVALLFKMIYMRHIFLCVYLIC